MALHGLTEEQLGQVAVAQRQFASMNPNAVMRSPISIEIPFALPEIRFRPVERVLPIVTPEVRTRIPVAAFGTAAPSLGLSTTYEERNSSNTALLRKVYDWAQNSTSENAYIGTVTRNGFAGSVRS